MQYTRAYAPRWCNVATLWLTSAINFNAVVPLRKQDLFCPVAQRLAPATFFQPQMYEKTRYLAQAFSGISQRKALLAVKPGKHAVENVRPILVAA